MLQETFPLPEELRQALPVSPSPYVGLRSFRREDARLFYGSSREIYELRYKLTHEASQLWIALQKMPGRITRTGGNPKTRRLLAIKQSRDTICGIERDAFTH